MMAVKRMLVPTDFSETSEAALKYALEMARSFGAQLYLLHVPGTTGEHFEADFPIGRFETSGRLNADEIKQLHPEYAVRIGAPAEEIVRYAVARDVDMIIMGTHGRSGLAHMVMGSVAEQVLRTAPCPVLLVRQAKSAPLVAEPVVARAAHQVQ